MREYDWLSEGALYGLLTPELQARLTEVETALDDLDEQSPGAQSMRRQMQRAEA